MNNYVCTVHVITADVLIEFIVQLLFTQVDNTAQKQQSNAAGARDKTQKEYTFQKNRFLKNRPLRKHHLVIVIVIIIFLFFFTNIQR